MNLVGQIEQHLPQQALELIKIVSREADKLGQKVYFVGGIVRDFIIGYPNSDIDLVIEGDAVRLAQNLAEVAQAKVLAHPRFGTAKLSCSNFTLDIATARREIYARPGALPTVSPGTLEDDLLRRDFSINAMAVSLASNNYGELIDPYHGKDDLERQLIRILHPKSFSDDATRILRAIRYEQRLGFELETQTGELLERDVPMLDTISGDRIRHELELILKEKYPERIIKRLGELGILQRINPFLEGNGWITEKFERVRQRSKPPYLPTSYFCLLIYRLSQKNGENLILRLNMPKKLARAIQHTLRLKAQLSLLDKPSLKPSEIYYLLHEYHLLAIQTNAIASKPGAACSYLELFLDKLRYVKTLLNGEELQHLGIPAGPKLGEILKILHKARLDGEVKTKSEEEKLALSLHLN